MINCVFLHCEDQNKKEIFQNTFSNYKQCSSYEHCCWKKPRWDKLYQFTFDAKIWSSTWSTFTSAKNRENSTKTQKTLRQEPDCMSDLTKKWSNWKYDKWLATMFTQKSIFFDLNNNCPQPCWGGYIQMPFCIDIGIWHWQKYFKSNF